MNDLDKMEEMLGEKLDEARERLRELERKRLAGIEGMFIKHEKVRKKARRLRSFPDGTQKEYVRKTV